MPIPFNNINKIRSPKLVSYQRLFKIVRENIPKKSIEDVAFVACNVFKEIQTLFPNKDFYGQVDEAIEAFKNNPNKYFKKDVIIITI
jgi:hypothetical protein